MERALAKAMQIKNNNIYKLIFLIFIMESGYLMRRAVRGAKRHLDRLSFQDYPNYDESIRGFRRPEEAITRELARSDILGRGNFENTVQSYWALHNAFQTTLRQLDGENKDKYLVAIQRRLKNVAYKLGSPRFRMHKALDGVTMPGYARDADYLANTMIPAHLSKSKVA